MTNELTDLTNIPAPTLTLDPVSDGEVAEVSIIEVDPPAAPSLADSLSAEELAQVEDAEIHTLVQKEETVGLKAVTDGEYRRSFWHLDFLWGLTGAQKVKSEHFSVAFKGFQPKAETVRIVDKLDFPDDHPFLKHFRFLQSVTAPGVQPKQCIPSPSMLHLICCVREPNYQPIERYKDEQVLLDDLAATYQKAVKAFYAAGCRYLQLDDTSWGEFCSAEKRKAYAERGIDVDDVEAVINYDLPNENEYYLHRIGRTGRAKKHGVAFTLLTYTESVRFDEILKYIMAKPIPLHFDEMGILTQEDGEPFFENM